MVVFSSPTSPFAVRLSGYGDMQFAFHDYGPNQNRQGGAQRDARLVFDQARFSLQLRAFMPFDVMFEGELELEHGGVATAQELDYEEFGEFEEEIEKGGEVLLEELYLRKTFFDRYSITVGRFYVAVGLLSRFYRPTDHLAATRSEAETTVIPAVWDEMGLQLQATFERVRITAQVLNGLDSSGFSSQRWVALGHQARFELVRATDLAYVARVDFTPPGSEVGVSAYYGGTSRNRPKADLVLDCAGGDGATVAPCGWADAPLLLLDLHVRLVWGPVRASALVLWGHLWNAAAVSSRNERLSNAANVLRSPVADQALAAWAEVGVDVAPWLGLGPAHRLEPFARVDYYDTMFGKREGLFDNPRFERLVWTLGLSYTLASAVVVKLEASQRRFGSGALRPETSGRLAVGFTY
ncbi:MAG: hypothetical protein IPJ65_13925 [Archangiaceae bacterium]|nr:hypothetical protein [Archangiaceae bacterium]